MFYVDKHTSVKICRYCAALIVNKLYMLMNFIL